MSDWGKSALVAALRQPSAYPHRVSEVGFSQTHISLIFFAGDRVYKVKKPVDLGFLDYTTLEARRHFCEEEVRLNRQLAPGVYLGVVPITRERDGSLRIGGDAMPVEYAVEMELLPHERMMDRLLDQGEIDNETMRALAALLARFHGEAATGPGVDEYGTPAAVAHNVRENFEQTAGFAARPGGEAPAGARTLSPLLHAFLSRRADEFLASNLDLLERRVAEGRIRDGHGDLHAGNICLTEQGLIVYDRIEFAARFRCGDVAADLAFVAMDLDFRGFRAFASYLVRCYAEHAQDLDLEALMDFYKGYRAVVRAKVGSFAAIENDLPAGERAGHRLDAMRHFHLAASYQLPLALILTCGLPASGKSFAAKAIAEPFEASVLRSDRERKRLAGLPPDRREPVEYAAGLYSPERTEKTYAALLDGAARTLRTGRTAVVDASFSSERTRRPFEGLARGLGAPFVLVELTAPEDTIRERLDRRARESGNPSDADFGIYREMRDRYEPPNELADPNVARVDARLPAEEITGMAIDRLVEVVDQRDL